RSPAFAAGRSGLGACRRDAGLRVWQGWGGLAWPSILLVQVVVRAADVGVAERGGGGGRFGQGSFFQVMFQDRLEAAIGESPGPDCPLGGLLQPRGAVDLGELQDAQAGAI